MARFDDSHITNLLAMMLPDGLIEKLAENTGAVQRERKIDIVMLVWTLVLGFDAGTKRSLASLRRKFQQFSGLSIARSSFHDRLSQPMAELMERLVDWMLKLRIQDTHTEISSTFEGFRRLLAIDSTVIQLHRLLADTWESTHPEQAAMKLHVVANINEGKANSVRLTDQTTHDTGPVKRIGKWVKGSLLMMDLGYYDFHLFHRIDNQDGYFLSRVKDGANPRIISSNIDCPGRSIDLAGKALKDVLGRLQREVIDVVVELPVTLRKYRGRRRTIDREFRMVGVRNDETGDYHLYFTNIEPDAVDARNVARAYSLRWQIELLFTRLKTNFRLHQLPTTKPHIVRILIYASILALLVSSELLKSMRDRRPDRIFPARRMDEVFSDFADLLLLKVASRRHSRDIDLFDLMLKEAADPNRTRRRSHDAVHDLPMLSYRAYAVFSEVTA